MNRQVLYGLLLAILVLLTACESDGYHEEDNHWTWKWYHGGNMEYVYSEIDSVDHNTFQVLNENYAIDDKHAYCRGSLIPQANPNSFEALVGEYSRDKEQVFLSTDVVIFANPKTFEVMKWPYSRDDSHVFCGTIPLNVDKAEVAEFQVTSDGVSSMEGTLLPYFIERNPEFAWLDTLGIDGVIYGEGKGETSTTKISGVNRELK